MKALIVGLNYEGTRAELRGCRNDAMDMFEYLQDKADSIKVMFKADKEELLYELDRLCKSDDDLWFHFSGHGTQTVDKDGDEDDGKDECLVTSDFKRIKDDDLVEIFSQVKRNCYCVVDACNSGTILDLDRVKCEGRICFLSGSLDGQNAKDTKIDGRWRGAMTAGLLASITDTLDLECAFDVQEWLDLNGYSQNVNYAETLSDNL